MTPAIAYAALNDLTFGMIADAWAHETITTGQNREQILGRMVQAMWRGEFEEDGISLLSLTTPGSALQPGVEVSADGKICGLEGANPVTRRGLLRVLALKGILPKLPEESPSEGDNGEEALARLARLSPLQFGPLVCGAYLEALIIAKDDFGSWCDSQGMGRPLFWFAASSQGQRTKQTKGYNNGL